MSTTRGLSAVEDPVWREGESPSASRLEMNDRLVRNISGAGGTRVMYRNGRIIISSGTVQKTEWTVVIAAATHSAIVYHRPIVFGARRIPNAWALDEDLDYSSDIYHTFYPPLSIDLLDGSSVGKGSGFISVEIDLIADTVAAIHTTARPVDDPPLSLVRWPLVHITETVTAPVPPATDTTYTWRIDAVLHTGQIKITPLFAP